MTLRGLVTGAICAMMCMGVFASDAAYAATARRAAICEPTFPGRMCPPFNSARCVPCKMKNGAPGCLWTPCAPWGR